MGCAASTQRLNVALPAQPGSLAGSTPESKAAGAPTEADRQLEPQAPVARIVSPAASGPAEDPTKDPPKGAAPQEQQQDAPAATEPPEDPLATTRLGITLRGLRKLRKTLEDHFGVEEFATLTTGDCKSRWVESVTKARRCRLVQFEAVVDPDDVAPPLYFIRCARREQRIKQGRCRRLKGGDRGEEGKSSLGLHLLIEVPQAPTTSHVNAESKRTQPHNAQTLRPHPANSTLGPLPPLRPLHTSCHAAMPGRTSCACCWTAWSASWRPPATPRACGSVSGA